ncbi:MAG: hypothetical protein WCK35_06360 [Chloroflexota bacterium]
MNGHWSFCWGWLAESLIVHLAQNGCQIYKSNHLKLRLTVVDPDAGREMV